MDEHPVGSETYVHQQNTLPVSLQRLSPKDRPARAGQDRGNEKKRELAEGSVLNASSPGPGVGGLDTRVRSYYYYLLLIAVEDNNSVVYSWGSR